MSQYLDGFWERCRCLLLDSFADADIGHSDLQEGPIVGLFPIRCRLDRVYSVVWQRIDVHAWFVEKLGCGWL